MVAADNLRTVMWSQLPNAVKDLVGAMFVAAGGSYNSTTRVVGFPASTGGGSGAVSSVAGRTGAVTLTKADVGLSNVDNTSDASKTVSLAQVPAGYHHSITLAAAKAAATRSVITSRTDIRIVVVGGTATSDWPGATAWLQDSWDKWELLP